MKNEKKKTRVHVEKNKMHCDPKKQANAAGKEEADEECEEDVEEASCTVCLCTGCESFLVPCKHTFHWDCIYRHLRRDSRCPNCQREVEILRDQNSSRCKCINYKRPKIEPDPSLFSAINSESDAMSLRCVDCHEICTQGGHSECQMCPGALHDTCGHNTEYGRLCTVCKVKSEPKDPVFDPEWLPSRKRRRLNR